MKKQLAAAALIVTCLTSGARAASLDVSPAPYDVPAGAYAVPQPNLIPLPGTIEPHWELGTRYWWSEGSSKVSINASRLDPALDIPNSTLTHDDAQGNTAEFVFRARTESNVFAKGFVGGGPLRGGNLTESGSFPSEGKFSYSDTSLGGTNLVYGTLDIGKRFTLSEGATKVTVGPFIGFNLWGEEIKTSNARCTPDDVICEPGNSHPAFRVPFDTDGVNWASLRLGGELQVKLFDRITLIGDAAALPVAYLVDNRGANLSNSGAGWGYQLEAALRVDLTPCWSLGSGVRYWFSEVTNGSSQFTHLDDSATLGNGSSQFTHLHASAALSDFTSQRFGVFGDVSYRF
jgi:hypothetical protein